MLIIDADTHYIEPHDWLEQVDPQLSAEIPYQKVLGSIITGTMGDMLESIPERYRPEPSAVLPASMKQFIQSMSDLPAAQARELIALNQGGSSTSELPPRTTPKRHG